MELRDVSLLDSARYPDPDVMEEVMGAENIDINISVDMTEME